MNNKWVIVNKLGASFYYMVFGVGTGRDLPVKIANADRSRPVPTIPIKTPY